MWPWTIGLPLIPWPGKTGSNPSVLLVWGTPLVQSHTHTQKKKHTHTLCDHMIIFLVLDNRITFTTICNFPRSWMLNHSSQSSISLKFKVQYHSRFHPSSSQEIVKRGRAADPNPGQLLVGSWNLPLPIHSSIFHTLHLGSFPLLLTPLEAFCQVPIGTLPFQGEREHESLWIEDVPKLFLLSLWCMCMENRAWGKSLQGHLFWLLQLVRMRCQRTAGYQLFGSKFSRHFHTSGLAPDGLGYWSGAGEIGLLA